MPARPVRLLIVNDSEIIVRGVAGMLAPFTDRVTIVETEIGDAGAVDESVVALFDTFAHVLPSPFDSQELRRRYQTRRIAIYTWNLARAAQQDATSGDVDGYLSKQLTGIQLVEALEQIHAGESVVDLAEGDQDRQNAWPGKEHGLTEREAEILVLIVRGSATRTSPTTST